MPKNSGFLLLGSFGMLFAGYLLMNANYTSAHLEAQSKNNPPIVKIVAPMNNSAHEWNSLVRYSIQVSDVEDGESKYEEIPSNEVFLELRYVGDPSRSAYLNRDIHSDPLGLEEMKNSGCFTCHGLKSKVLGPSLEEITKRYTDTPTTREMLAERITAGSSGVWGKAAMPSHPALTREAADLMVEWILKNSADPNLDYFTGLTGAFRIVPPAAQPKGTFVITATYIDHGLKDKTKQNQKGRDVIIIRGK